MLTDRIRAIQAASDAIYGSPNFNAELRELDAQRAVERGATPLFLRHRTGSPLRPGLRVSRSRH